MEIYLVIQNGSETVNKTNCSVSLSLTQVAVDDLAESVASHLDGGGS